MTNLTDRPKTNFSTRSSLGIAQFSSCDSGKQQVPCLYFSSSTTQAMHESQRKQEKRVIHECVTHPGLSSELVTACSSLAPRFPREWLHLLDSPVAPWRWISTASLVSLVHPPSTLSHRAHHALPPPLAHPRILEKTDFGNHGCV